MGKTVASLRRARRRRERDRQRPRKGDCPCGCTLRDRTRIYGTWVSRVNRVFQKSMIPCPEGRIAGRR